MSRWIYSEKPEELTFEKNMLDTNHTVLKGGSFSIL